MSVLIFLAIASLARAQTPFEQAAKTLTRLSSKERQARLEKEARREGSVSWATSMTVAWAEPVVEGFRKKYPGIQLAFSRVSGRALADRAIREYQAGTHEVDVLGSSAITFWGVKQSGMITSYLSPETVALPSDRKDAKGFWGAPYSNVLAVICNKNRVKVAPKEWKEFAEPKWKGDFSIDTERFQWFYALQKIYGDEGAKKLLRAYVQNGAQMRRGGTLQSQLVAAGEYSCAVGVYLDSIYLLLKAGAPVVYSVPEPVPLSPTIIMMPKFPPHPYGAILLYDFLLSPEGMSLSARNNALFPTNERVAVVDEVKLLKGRPTYFIDIEETSRDYKKLSEAYQSLLKNEGAR